MTGGIFLYVESALWDVVIQIQYRGYVFRLYPNDIEKELINK